MSGGNDPKHSGIEYVIEPHAPTQPPSPAQRIEAAVESLRPRKCDDMGETDAALATVRAALKEMEEEHANETADLIWAHSTASVAVREFKEQAVAKMEALKYASCGFMPLSQFADHNETIDKCISILKGDQA